MKSVLHELFAEEQAFTWQEGPLNASYEDQRAQDDRLDSALPADFERAQSPTRRFSSACARSTGHS
jgi:hypothetical protein